MPPKSLAERLNELEELVAKQQVQIDELLAKLKRQAPTRMQVKPTREEMVFFCESLGLPSSDGEILFDKWTGSGWKTAAGPIKDWQATIRSWQRQQYLPSQKTTENQFHGRARANSQPASGDLNSKNRYARKP